MFQSRLFACFGLLALGCGAEPIASEGPDGGIDEPAPDAAGDPEPEEHYLMPLVAYSGFDGNSTFVVPIYTSLEDASFAVEDEAIAGVEPVELSPELEEVLGTFGRSWAMITTRQAGTTTYFASAGAVELEATLEVSAYDPADVAVGDQRYNDPANPNDTNRIACQVCHGGPDGVDHTPLAMAYFQDHEILQVIAEGQYPSGDLVNEGNHTWDLTEAEAAGIVPYLRSLQPRGF